MYVVARAHTEKFNCEIQQMCKILFYFIFFKMFSVAFYCVLEFYTHRSICRLIYQFQIPRINSVRSGTKRTENQTSMRVVHLCACLHVCICLFRFQFVIHKQLDWWRTRPIETSTTITHKHIDLFLAVGFTFGRQRSIVSLVDTIDWFLLFFAYTTRKKNH